MNKSLILLIALFTMAFTEANSQDSWQIIVNKKTILKGIVGDEATTAVIKAGTPIPKGCIYIKFKSASNEAGWKRTFYINNTQDHVVKSFDMPKQSGTICIKASSLKILQENKQPFVIYTTSIPNDPAQAASVRVRRFMLCKIEWN